MLQDKENLAKVQKPQLPVNNYNRVSQLLKKFQISSRIPTAVPTESVKHKSVIKLASLATEKRLLISVDASKLLSPNVVSFAMETRKLEIMWPLQSPTRLLRQKITPLWLLQEMVASQMDSQLEAQSSMMRFQNSDEVRNS